jgi:hypothetical protein
VNAHRRARLWSLVTGYARGGPVAIEHVGAAMVATSGVDGAAITVMLDATPRETVYASDQIASVLEELTLTLGEGPGVDAFAGQATLVADLTTPDCLTRWPVFAPAAVRAGVCAMFALPLRVGGIRVGAVDLYRASPGPLDREPLADALVLADTACALLLDAAYDDPSQPHRHGSDQASLRHPEVHQATGMITVQLGVTAAVALIRLRAYAYSHDRRLRDVARDVVARRLRLAADGVGDGVV